VLGLFHQLALRGEDALDGFEQPCRAVLDQGDLVADPLAQIGRRTRDRRPGSDTPVATIIVLDPLGHGHDAR
jgi:hypothetical protein